MTEDTALRWPLFLPLTSFTFAGQPVNITEKPMTLLLYLMEHFGLEKGWVVDLFCGSMSLLGPAWLSGRHYLGIDSDRDQLSVAVDRRRGMQSAESRANTLELWKKFCQCRLLWNKFAGSDRILELADEGAQEGEGEVDEGDEEQEGPKEEPKEEPKTPEAREEY